MDDGEDKITGYDVLAKRAPGDTSVMSLALIKESWIAVDGSVALPTPKVVAVGSSCPLFIIMDLAPKRESS
jgi:hypothetical protein